MKEKLEGFPKPYLEVKEGDPGLLGDSISTFFFFSSEKLMIQN